MVHIFGSAMGIFTGAERIDLFFIPLIFDPGEANQFDWSHEIVVIDGATTTVKLAHDRLRKYLGKFGLGWGAI